MGARKRARKPATKKSFTETKAFVKGMTKPMRRSSTSLAGTKGVRKAAKPPRKVIWKPTAEVLAVTKKTLEASEGPQPAAAPIFLKAAPPTKEDRVVAYLSARSVGGISIFAGNAPIGPETVQQFFSEPKTMNRICWRMDDLGFAIERVGRLSIRVVGSKGLFEKKLGIKMERRSHENAFQARWMATPDTLANLDLGEDADGLAFPQPVELHAPKADPPKPPAPAYHHLTIPDDVVAGLNAGAVHASGVRGEGVRAAMIDSGFAWDHPYFTKRGYRVEVALPAGSFADASGHGTGESANFLGLAPEAKLYGLGMDDAIEAFQVARDDLRVQIISNSWGSALPTEGTYGTWDPYWSLVKAEIALCVQRGIIVLFSAGNGGMSFTASMPETISVGGAYLDAQGQLWASNYASSFASTRFPGQKVPEICGLVGMRPRAVYITLPVPEGCEIDQKYGGGAFPNADQTGKSDGWALFSGTSAACPMVAGVVGLILSKHPDAKLDEVRQRLYQATDVQQGTSAMLDAAGPGYDLATGHGLVDAARACA